MTIEAINKEEDQTQRAIMVNRAIATTDLDLAQIMEIVIDP